VQKKESKQNLMEINLSPSMGICAAFYQQLGVLVAALPFILGMILVSILGSFHAIQREAVAGWD